MKNLLVSLAALLMLSACGSSNASARRPTVVATAYPFYEVAAMVGGKHIHASNALPLDISAEIAPAKAEMLRNADLAIVLGGGTQPNVDKIVAQRTGPTISILGEGDVHASSTDYNVWLDPQRMASIAEVVGDAVRRLVPGDDAAIHKNLGRYLGSVADVDRDYSSTLAACKKNEFLVEKPQMSSLASRYGLQQTTVGLLSTKSPNADAVSIIQKSKATTVFATSLPSLSDAGRIRKDYDVRVAVLDPIATQTDQARRGGATYREVMELNLDALRAALDCRPKST